MPKEIVDIEALPVPVKKESPFKTVKCEVLSYNRFTHVVGFRVDDVMVQTILGRDLAPNTQFINVKYRKNEAGELEFIIL